MSCVQTLFSATRYDKYGKNWHKKRAWQLGHSQRNDRRRCMGCCTCAVWQWWWKPRWNTELWSRTRTSECNAKSFWKTERIKKKIHVKAGTQQGHIFLMLRMQNWKIWMSCIIVKKTNLLQLGGQCGKFLSFPQNIVSTIFLWTTKETYFARILQDVLTLTRILSDSESIYGPSWPNVRYQSMPEPREIRWRSSFCCAAVSSPWNNICMKWFSNSPYDTDVSVFVTTLKCLKLVEKRAANETMKI